MRTPPLRLLAALALVVAAAGCGKGSSSASLTSGARPTPVPAKRGVVSVATKNTTRLGGAGPTEDAAAVARTVYPGLTAATRPQAVVLVDRRNWLASLAASTLASAPLGAPLLYANGDQLPEATLEALNAMRPLGAAALAGAQVIRIATTAAVPSAYNARTVSAGAGTAAAAGASAAAAAGASVGADDAASAAAAIARLELAVRGSLPHQAIVVEEGAARALQMPAAGLSAESGAPILFVSSTHVPAATGELLKALHRPAIYLLAAPALSAAVRTRLARLGRVSSVAGTSGVEAAAGASGDPIENAISVSRYGDGSFGWAIHEAGHGLVFASSLRPLDAPAAAPLSAHGDYGPLLLVGDGASVPPPLARYLSDIEPGYTPAVAPVREVYNHGWLIGDEHAISALAQAEIDAILEIAPRAPSSNEQTLPPPE